jgi:hypothetical protein
MKFEEYEQGDQIIMLLCMGFLVICGIGMCVMVGTILLEDAIWFISRILGR